MFVDAFLNDCRVSHMVQLMGYHPSYLDQFVKTHHFVMRGDGPLPLHWRNFIATMVRGFSLLCPSIFLFCLVQCISIDDTRSTGPCSILHPNESQLYYCNNILAYGHMV